MIRNVSVRSFHLGLPSHHPRELKSSCWNCLPTEAHPGWVNQFSLLTASFHLKTELGSPLSFLSSTKYFFFSQCCYLIRGSFLAWPDLIYESLFSGQSPICQSSFYTLELRAEWHVLGVCHGANGCRKLPSSPPAALFQGLSVSVCRNLSWSQVKKAKISTSGVKYNGVIAADTPVRSRPLSPPLSLPRCFLLPPVLPYFSFFSPSLPPFPAPLHLHLHLLFLFQTSLS